MHFKDISFKTKLVGSYILAFIFLLIIGGIGINGFFNLKDSLNNLVDAKNYERRVLELQIAHHNWVERIEEAILRKKFSHLSIAKTDKECELGQWLHSDDSRRLMGQFSAMSSILSELKSRHSALHREVQLFREAAVEGYEALDQNYNSFSSNVIPKFNQVKKALGETVEFLDLQMVQEIKYVDDDIAYNKSLITYMLIIGLLIAIPMAYFLIKQTTSPLAQCCNLVKAIEEGDLTQHLHSDNHDEVGTMVSMLGSMSGKLNTMMQDLKVHAEDLSGSSGQLSNISGNLSNSARDMNERSANAAARADEVSTSMSAVSVAVDEATSNINDVASNTEEMTSTVAEIAKNSENARRVTSEAVSSVQSASERVNELGVSAKEVNKVIEVIVDIAEQTKLLALNATIEAARAGEAGKGFAVVANEVKELAKQTNDATGDIRERINGIQNSTNLTVSEIRNINDVILQVEEIVNSIATAVEEQSVTTRDISGNINQAALGMNDIKQNITQTSEAASVIAEDIGFVSGTSEGVNTESAVISSNTSELNNIGKNIRAIVDRFQVK